MVDVNMAITKNKVTKEQMFKDKKPIKKKFTTNSEEELRLCEPWIIIQQIVKL
jgi:hypothetical protein